VVRGFAERIGETIVQTRRVGVSADIVRTNDTTERAAPLDGIRLVGIDSDREELFPDRLGAGDLLIYDE
jgi:hypothetical protein